MGLEFETDKIIAGIDKKLKALKKGEVMEINNLKPGHQVTVIKDIYSDKFKVTDPVRDEDNYSNGNPRYVLYISLMQEVSSHA